MSNQFPSREITMTFTHPLAYDELFCRMVDQAMREVTEARSESISLDSQADGKHFGTFTASNGVIVTLTTEPRT